MFLRFRSLMWLVSVILIGSSAVTCIDVSIPDDFRDPNDPEEIDGREAVTFSIDIVPFEESIPADDGSVTGSIRLFLTNGEIISDTHSNFSAFRDVIQTKVSPGLVVDLTRVDSKTVELTLTGNATSHGPTDTRAINVAAFDMELLFDVDHNYFRFDLLSQDIYSFNITFFGLSGQEFTLFTMSIPSAFTEIVDDGSVIGNGIIDVVYGTFLDNLPNNVVEWGAFSNDINNELRIKTGEIGIDGLIIDITRIATNQLGFSIVGNSLHHDTTDSFTLDIIQSYLERLIDKTEYYKFNPTGQPPLRVPIAFNDSPITVFNGAVTGGLVPNTTRITETGFNDGSVQGLYTLNITNAFIDTTLIGHLYNAINLNLPKGLNINVNTDVVTPTSVSFSLEGMAIDHSTRNLSITISPLVLDQIIDKNLNHNLDIVTHPTLSFVISFVDQYHPESFFSRRAGTGGFTEESDNLGNFLNPASGVAIYDLNNAIFDNNASVATAIVNLEQEVNSQLDGDLEGLVSTVTVTTNASRVGSISIHLTGQAKNHERLASERIFLSSILFEAFVDTYPLDSGIYNPVLNQTLSFDVNFIGAVLGSSFTFSGTSLVLSERDENDNVFEIQTIGIDGVGVGFKYLPDTFSEMTDFQSAINNIIPGGLVAVLRRVSDTRIEIDIQGTVTDSTTEVINGGITISTILVDQLKNIIYDNHAVAITQSDIDISFSFIGRVGLLVEILSSTAVEVAANDGSIGAHLVLFVYTLTDGSPLAPSYNVTTSPASHSGDWISFYSSLDSRLSKGLRFDQTATIINGTSHNMRIDPQTYSSSHKSTDSRIGSGAILFEHFDLVIDRRRFFIDERIQPDILFEVQFND